MIPRRFLMLLDAIVLVGAFLVAHEAAPELQGSIAPGGPLRPWVEVLAPPSDTALGQFRPVNEVFWVLLVMIAANFVVMSAFSGYQMLLRQSKTAIVLTSWLSAASGLAFVTLVLFALHSPRWSRLFIFSFLVLGGLSLCATRLALRWYQLKRHVWGFYTRNVAVAGPAHTVAQIARHFEQFVPAHEYRLVGILATTPGEPAPDGTLPVLGEVERFSDILVTEPLHEVIAVQPAQGGAWVSKLVEDCDYFRLTLRIVPESLLSHTLTDLKIRSHANPLRLPEVVLEAPELGSESIFLKRVIDIAVSAALLILLLPLFAVVALIIKLTTRSLPVFYRYRAVGLKGRHFVTYKFTSMIANADAQKATLIAHNVMTGPAFKMKDDPRVTPFGRILRKFSIDELPQLWSVFKGDMSLVGPRPAPPHEVQRYELWHKRKLSVRPGITCLWQVGGRNKINSFDEWVRLDFEYIDNWSLWLDIKILARTAWVVVSGTGW